MIKYLSLTDYEMFWAECQSSMRVAAPNLHPSLKNMTVQGLSGPGTKFANEYDRMRFEHYNPPMPPEIKYYGATGDIVIYRPEKK
jgi:hypothetical protein